LGGEECSCSYAENVVVPVAKVVVGNNINFADFEMELVVSDVGSVVVWEKKSAAADVGHAVGERIRL
jgi:hypothetical protein